MNARALLLALAVCLVAVSSAHAADSHAPKGARGDWLPRDEWVMSSWLPYDEARLYALLDVDRATVDAWLDDHRSLGALARRRGVRSLRTFAARLVATRGGSAARRRVLRARALDTLTQPHLARHVFFHVFHTPAIPDAAPRLFGIRPATFRRERDSGMSPASIGMRHGRSIARVTAALRRLLGERARRAVRVGASSRRQSAALLAHQEADLDGYVSRTFRTRREQIAFVCAGGQASKHSSGLQEFLTVR